MVSDLTAIALSVASILLNYFGVDSSPELSLNWEKNICNEMMLNKSFKQWFEKVKVLIWTLFFESYWKKYFHEYI